MGINKKINNWKVKAITYLIGILVLVVFFVLAYSFQKNPLKDILGDVQEKVFEPSELDLIVCANNCEHYINCKTFQKSSEDYCYTAYDGLSLFDSQIINSRIRCSLLIGAEEIIERKNIEDCNDIILSDGYDENVGEHRGLVEICYILISDSRESCKEIEVTDKVNEDFDIFDSGWISFCDFFFDYFRDNKKNEIFQSLSNEDQDAVILLNAFKSRDANLCSEIGEDAKRNQCRILLDDPEAQKAEFCESSLNGCYDLCFS